MRDKRLHGERAGGVHAYLREGEAAGTAELVVLADAPEPVRVVKLARSKVAAWLELLARVNAQAAQEMHSHAPSGAERERGDGRNA